jgi:hypothetical protein
MPARQAVVQGVRAGVAPVRRGERLGRIGVGRQRLVDVKQSRDGDALRPGRERNRFGAGRAGEKREQTED